MVDHHAYCEALVRENDRDRYLSTLFVPADKRPALFALYAFDIEVSRVAQLVKEPMAGEIRLQWWRDVIGGESHSGGSPVATALIETMREYRLSESTIVRLIEAHQQALHPGDAGLSAEDQAVQLGAPVFELAVCVLGGDVKPDAVRLSRTAGIARVLVSSPTALDAAAIAIVRASLRDAKDALTISPEKLWPAFLPLAVIPAMLRRIEKGRSSGLPQWRRQWILWRAARDLPAALA